MNAATKIAVIATLAMAGILVSQAAEEAAPNTFVSLKLEGACDAQNNRLWLTNTHTFKTVATTVRWRAAGGKDLSEQFYPGPNSIREIGCAAEAEIIEAKFARATDSLKEIQRQLAQDAAMYFPQGGQCDRMIAFVWDDAARTEEHATLIQGLEKLDHVAGVVVVSRPAKMQHQPGAASTAASGGEDT